MSDEKNLVPGKRYRLEGDDCCIHFTVLCATFVRYAPDDNDHYEYVFDVISVGPDWGSWKAVELQ